MPRTRQTKTDKVRSMLARPQGASLEAICKATGWQPHSARAALLAAWSETFGSPAPRGISRAYLRRFLAFEIQARAGGGLSRRTVAALRRRGGGPGRRAVSPALRPGGRLLREWNGVTHVVDVTDGGFAWKGETWRSLSAIAREITGAHWSGPRFFGLNGTARS